MLDGPKVGLVSLEFPGFPSFCLTIDPMDEKGLLLSGGQWRVLVVEDDSALASLVSERLDRCGFRVEVSDGRDDVISRFRSFAPHAVLLDIGLPGCSGYQWCDLIRRESRCPVLFVSAQSGEADQILGLMRGGDDFVCKPFSIDVLKAKLEAQIRRAYGELSAKSDSFLSYGDLQLSERKMLLSCGGREVELTKTELAAIRLLLSEGGCVISRARLLREVWDDESFVEDNTLNVVVGRIRKRLVQVGSSACVRAVRGVGYVLEMPLEEK